jgi:hypothetical protein
MCRRSYICHGKPNSETIIKKEAEKESLLLFYGLYWTDVFPRKWDFVKTDRIIYYKVRGSDPILFIHDPGDADKFQNVYDHLVYLYSRFFQEMALEILNSRRVVEWND